MSITNSALLAIIAALFVAGIYSLSLFSRLNIGIYATFVAIVNDRSDKEGHAFWNLRVRCGVYYQFVSRFILDHSVSDVRKAV